MKLLACSRGQYRYTMITSCLYVERQADRDEKQRDASVILTTLVVLILASLNFGGFRGPKLLIEFAEINFRCFSRIPHFLFYLADLSSRIGRHWRK